MKRTVILIVSLTAAICLCALARMNLALAAESPSSPPISPSPAAMAGAPEVPPAAPGVFSSQRRGAMRYHLSLHGRIFTSRDAIEKYLAYRAAQLTLDDHYPWFILIENRAKSDKVPVPKSDPSGKRYSFRMAFWRPLWRYKVAGSDNWKSWSPFSGAAFFADGLDPKTIGAYEVSADIVFHQGIDDQNPLAFDASALSDFLVNQVSPPQ